MPFCPTCESNSRVGAHSFHKDHLVRQIIGLKQNYFIVSRQCICYDCKIKHDQLKNEMMLLDGNVNTTKLPQHIFMGYNEETLSLLPYGYGLHFPAFLSHRSGLDKGIIDLMRPLVDTGTRLHSFYQLLKELHTEKYYALMI